VWRFPLLMWWLLNRAMATSAAPALRVSPVNLITDAPSSRSSTNPPLSAMIAFSSRNADCSGGRGALALASRVPAWVPR
jgi:hypothetical protein